MIQLEHSFEGPFNAGCYVAQMPTGREVRLSGKSASMISLLLAGYQLKDDFQPLEAFTDASLAPGRMNAKVVRPDEVSA